MTALLLIRRGGDIVGQCDVKCYEAKNALCLCICGGVNHQAGLDQAIVSTRALAESWVERACVGGQQIDSYELDPAATQDPLF